MEGRNRYKDLVMGLLAAAFAIAAIWQAEDFFKEHRAYEFFVWEDESLSKETVEQFQKLSGIQSFLPIGRTSVTLKLGTYVVETELTGIELTKCRFQWETPPKEAALSHTPALFLGKELFFGFSDPNGFPPTKGQVEQWIAEYETLALTVTDEGGRERKATVCGILKQPEAAAYMEKGQMEDIFSRRIRTTGGRMKIYGFRNMEKAREILEAAGFQVEEGIQGGNLRQKTLAIIDCRCYTEYR